MVRARATAANTVSRKEVNRGQLMKTQVIRRVVSPDQHDPVRLPINPGFEQNRIQDTEYGCVSANAESEAEHGCSGEARVLA
jgi:hypothetical protein